MTFGLRVLYVCMFFGGDATAYSVPAAREEPIMIKVEPSMHLQVHDIDEPVTRTHGMDSASVGLTDLTSKVANELLSDPIALTSSLLLLAYFIGSVLVRKPTDMKVEEKRPEPKRSKPPPSKKFGGLNVKLNVSITSQHTIDGVLDFAMKHNDDTDIVNVVTAIHRSTKLAVAEGSVRGLADDARLRCLVAKLLALLDNDLQAPVLTRAVGNAAWALAKLNYQDTEIQEALQCSFTLYAEHFKPEELMNTVWAFAEFGRDKASKETDGRAMKVAKAAARCATFQPQFTVQQMVYFGWALARLADRAPIRANQQVKVGFGIYTKQIVESVAPAVAHLTTKNLAMVCWAVAQTNKVVSSTDVSPLFLSVAQEAIRRGFSQFQAGELASILWALSKAHSPHADYMRTFRDFAMATNWKGFCSQDIANTLCAYVNHAAGDKEFYASLVVAVEARASQFNRQEKSMLAWGFEQIPECKAPVM
jgi:hypothetical protein